MNRTKTCPICENQIPKDITDFCFYCGFNLKKVNDKKQLAREKYAFSGEKSAFEFWLSSASPKGPRPAFDLIVGLSLGGALFIIILNARAPSGIWSGSLNFFYCLLFGFIAGFIIYLFDLLIY